MSTRSPLRRSRRIVASLLLSSASATSLSSAAAAADIGAYLSAVREASEAREREAIRIEDEAYWLAQAAALQTDTAAHGPAAIAAALFRHHLALAERISAEGPDGPAGGYRHFLAAMRRGEDRKRLATVDAALQRALADAVVAERNAHGSAALLGLGPTAGVVVDRAADSRPRSWDRAGPVAGQGGGHSR